MNSLILMVLTCLSLEWALPEKVLCLDLVLFLLFSCMYFYVHQFFSFVFYTICWLLQMSSKRYVGFADGTNCHTCNLSSVPWVIYSPSGQLVASGGTCLGPTSNNVAEYRAIIELLWDGLSHGITQLEVRLDSQLVVSQLN